MSRFHVLSVGCGAVIGRVAKFWYAPFIREAEAVEIGAEAAVLATPDPPATDVASRGALATAAPTVPANTAVIALEPAIKERVIIQGPRTALPMTQIASRIQYSRSMAPVAKACAPGLFVGLTAILISACVSRSHTAQASGQRQIATRELKNWLPMEIWVYTGAEDNIARDFYSSLDFEVIGPAHEWARGKTTNPSDVVLRQKLIATDRLSSQT
jgi:hypothetical protein